MYVFGNEHLPEDAFALKVADHLRLQGVSIVHCTTPESLLEAEEDELIILDVVKDLAEPAVIDPDRIRTNRMMSLHDLDVGHIIELGQAMGIIKKLKIIGVPQKGNPQKIAEQVKQWIP